MHQHDDPHHHDHGEEGHEHRDLQVSDQPLDAANQSLADALRASFNILKGIMVVLLVLYLFSNVQCVSGHEQALVVRLGELQPGVHEAGLVRALPFPIDEILRLPTRKFNELTVNSHSFRRRPEEEGKPLEFISRGSHAGLDPAHDGALMTSDLGLVHARWKVTFKIDDVQAYITLFEGHGDVTAAEELIQTLVEAEGIKVASEMTAEEVIRTRVDYAQTELKRRVNERLADMGSGISVSTLEMFEPTPPLQIRSAFDATQAAENSRQQTIRKAEQDASKILSDTAGGAYRDVLAVLDELDTTTDPARKVELEAERDRLLTEVVEGETGDMLKAAGAYHATVVGRIKADVELYRTLLPEYERNPRLLVERLWQQAFARIMQNGGVQKIYRPNIMKELRLLIGIDPDEKRILEQKQLEQKSFDPSKLRPESFHPVGPEAG